MSERRHALPSTRHEPQPTAEVHPTADELAAGLARVRSSPSEVGALVWIVRRPEEGEREVLERVRLTLAEGVEGDDWSRRPSKRTPDRSPHPDMQLNVMNVHAADLVAGGHERRALCGDQLYVDLDLSPTNLPPGTRLAIGDEACIEVTAQPHRGCAKFAQRFGHAALRWVNSEEGVALNLRGVNAKVVRAGLVCVGDTVRRV